MKAHDPVEPRRSGLFLGRPAVLALVAAASVLHGCGAARPQATAPQLGAHAASPASVAPTEDFAGCESVHLAPEAPCDAQGRTLTPWRARRDDAVANQADQYLTELERADAPSAAARIPAVVAWSSAHPEHPYPPYVLGRFYAVAGQREPAIAAQRRALELAPGFESAEYDLGLLLHDAGHSDEAFEHFRRAVALEPGDSFAQFNVAMHFYLRGEFEGSLAHFCAARRAAPDDFDNAKKVVQALYALGRFADAERARAAVRALWARSADPTVRERRNFVIDQLHVGDEDVMVYEILQQPNGPRHHYLSFVCQRGETTTRAVTLSTSDTTRREHQAAALGIMRTRGEEGTFETTTIGFATLPDYPTVRPHAVRLIEQLQREERASGAPAGDSLEALLGPDGAAQTQPQLEAIARFIRRLEGDPSRVLREVDPSHDADGRQASTLLLRWLVDSHDVSVQVGPWQAVLVAPEAHAMPQLVLGAMLGMAAYVIEHRTEHPAPGGDAVQLAGVESAARWYEALVRDGAAHVAALDALVAARDRHALPLWLVAHSTPSPAPHGRRP